MWAEVGRVSHLYLAAEAGMAEVWAVRNAVRAHMDKVGEAVARHIREEQHRLAIVEEKSGAVLIADMAGRAVAHRPQRWVPDKAVIAGDQDVKSPSAGHIQKAELWVSPVDWRQSGE